MSDAIQMIRQLSDGVRTQREIADLVGVTRVYVSRIVCALDLPKRHVGRPVGSYGSRLRNAREAVDSRREISDERNAQVMSLLDQGLTYGQIAEKTGLTRSTVAGVVFREKNKGPRSTKVRQSNAWAEFARRVAAGENPEWPS